MSWEKKTDWTDQKFEYTQFRSGDTESHDSFRSENLNNDDSHNFERPANRHNTGKGILSPGDLTPDSLSRKPDMAEMVCYREAIISSYHQLKMIADKVVRIGQHVDDEGGFDRKVRCDSKWF
jgi:hypothetical protein